MLPISYGPSGERQFYVLENLSSRQLHKTATPIPH